MSNLDKLIDVIAQHFDVEKNTLSENTNFVNDLSADSLDAVEIVLKIEEVFGIEVSPDEEETLNTVSDLVNLLKKKEVLS